MGRTAEPDASVAPPLACIDSMRPMPASRFQLMPQPGYELAINRSAFWYAFRAIIGMRRVPGELTTTAGGGPEMLEVEAMWKAVGALVAATTEGPDGSMFDRAT